MDRIDLRSDTVSWPTPKMRHAMMEAAVGDDVYGEDPTVNELEAKAAKKFGKEAAVFVTSGTMGNITALLAHCGRGERVIMGDRSHTNTSEVGNPASLGGIQAWTVPVQPDGTMRLEDLRASVTSHDYHYPVTKLISVENAQCGTGGQPLPIEYIRQVGDICHENHLSLHIDGARIFHAVTALGSDAASLSAPADSLTFCLSKGLCAPVGSILVGSEEFIDRARRVRKMLGGGLRQAGVLAAAGIIAVEEMSERLQEDHDNARMLAEGLAEIPGIEIDVQRVRTNMIFFGMHEDAPLNAHELAEKLKADNIWIGARGPYNFRMVTHYWIKPEHIEQVLSRINHYLS